MGKEGFARQRAQVGEEQPERRRQNVSRSGSFPELKTQRVLSVAGARVG